MAAHKKKRRCQPQVQKLQQPLQQQQKLLLLLKRRAQSLALPCRALKAPRTLQALQRAETSGD